MRRDRYLCHIGLFYNALTLACMMLSATLARAEAYRLVPGDRVLLSFTDIEAPTPMTVSIDGQIRLIGFGAIKIAGMNLEAAQSRIADVLQNSGQYVSPTVDLIVQEYAPVTVAGQVVSPGRFEYAPGMNVASALALAGGPLAVNGRGQDQDLKIADLQGRKRGFERAIAAQTAKVARLAAVQAGGEMDSEPPVRSPGQSFWQAEREMMQAEGKRLESLLGTWRVEITALERHRTVMTARLNVQEKVSKAANARLGTAKGLKEKGLGTAGQLATAQQAFDSSQSDTLELQSLIVATEAALAKAQLSRESYLAQRADRLTEELHAANLALIDAQENLTRVSAQLEVLQALGGGERSLCYEIHSLRPGRQNMTDIGYKTPMLPGDTLILRSIDRIAPEDGCG